MIHKRIIRKKLNHNLIRVKSTLQWIILSVVIGVVVGLISGAFGYSLNYVTSLRTAYPALLLGLPFGAIIIVALYQLILKKKDPGTNLVLSAIHSDDKLPLRMAPLIFISTIITHLVGGSAGREGAALQLGGSVGGALGDLFHLHSKDDKNIMIMCGMSAAFSALFGTPMAAAVFSMEVVSVGIMHYAALLPCAISSLIARQVALQVFGLSAEGFSIISLPEFSLSSAAAVSVLAVLSGFVSILFCIVLRQTSRLSGRYITNPYLKALLGGCLVLVLTLIVGDQTYNGTGTSMIASCIAGQVTPSAFILKIIFTALTLACGYKGGEIVPSFFIGAAFGSLFGNLLGFSPSLCAAVGMGALFCGVTNCPLTSLLICFELFGYKGTAFFLLAIGFSYTVSGYYGLYSSQRIVYSKYKSNYIDRQVR